MMEPLFTLEPPEVEVRVLTHSHQKSNGVHYTPYELAGFVARRALAQLPVSEFVVLDPACGDGELLLATAVEAEAIGLPAPHLVGIDKDDEAIAVARGRLAAARASTVVLRASDFLAMGLQGSEGIPSAYDLVISNPPYVRTQVLGAARAQAL
jgi:adenine-specific DNA-methyltransferase